MTLVGLPNAGKSSLLNRLVGEAVAIVTPKAQTTRTNMRGFVVRDGIKLVVTDTPGLQDGAKALNQALSRNATRALKDAAQGRELVAFVVDLFDIVMRLQAGKTTNLETLPELFARDVDSGGRLKMPVIPVMNKSDAIKNADDRAKAEAYVRGLLEKAFESVQPTIFISSKSGAGVDEFLTDRVAPLLEESDEELFQEDLLTDQPMREIAAEFIREQCFLCLGHELPYSVAVEIDKFDEKDPRMLRIEALLHVERESQKAIVIGTGAAKIKEIGMNARRRLEGFLGQKVFLGLKVKVSPNWSKEERLVERFGYGSAH